ncbi:DMT family transporter [Rossellomorea sp. BNER]|uniref:DMT family transporter n=1 Tax=Rossellomorea sp. BNER TaxID=2962031 RepID=UPI003AF27F7C|nr:multidrug efflux SMR transporter [Rossellomorea sp. BNER]
MAWIYLIIGGFLEIAWALGLKFSKGFSLPLPSIITIILIASSFYFFAKAMKLISIGTAYAIFTGIGAAGTAIVGMIFLDEPVSFLKIFFILLLLSCVIGLKLTNHEETASTNEQESLQA